VREVLESEYLARPLEDGPAPRPSERAQRDHVGVVRQSDGRFYVGAAPRVGRTAGHELVRVADLADEHGSGQVRLTTQQKIVVLGVEPERVEDLVAGLEAIDLQVRSGPLRSTAMACTGSEFCKIAVVETKGRAAALVKELELRLPELTEPVRIHMNGCPNSCARFQVADIGLLGSLVPGPDGERVEGFQVHLGGHLGAGSAIGSRVKGLRVRADELEDYLEGLLRSYLDTRDDDEPFHRWAARAEDAWVQPQVVAAR
jgi:sulfite reductase (ferredoxin)